MIGKLLLSSLYAPDGLCLPAEWPSQASLGFWFTQKSERQICLIYCCVAWYAVCGASSSHESSSATSSATCAVSEWLPGKQCTSKHVHAHKKLRTQTLCILSTFQGACARADVCRLHFTAYAHKSDVHSLHSTAHAHEPNYTSSIDVKTTDWWTSSFGCTSQKSGRSATCFDA